MIDPYLSDSVREINPQNYRRVAVDECLFEVKPNVMIFTHNHLDHYDPKTVERVIAENSNILVLAPQSVWNEVRKYGGKNNYVLFNRHTQWTENGIRFTAVKAEHSDISPIGIIIDDGHKKYYVTGDTLYNEEIFEDIGKDIYALFLPVNGVGNNMNMTDAARFAERVNAQRVVPMHIGMFDELTADNFECENKVIPEIYKEIKI
jgi:L-ascorbate metabolism protein UlaG (beta-lactamase superfamily)